MKVQEFSSEFDILYNNISSNQAPGLDEYEKSVFLTKAQNEIVKAYFSAKENKVLEGFDGSEKRQYDFSMLINTTTLFNVNKYKERITPEEKLDNRSEVFVFPVDYFLSINEVVADSKRQYAVTPLAYNEYQRLMQKPYALPAKKAAWRLFTSKKACNYLKEYATVDTEDKEEFVAVKPEYSFFTSWASADKTVRLFINTRSFNTGEDKDTFTWTGKTIYFVYNGYKKAAITVGSSWHASKNAYDVHLNVVIDDNVRDDADVATAIREGFKQFAEYGKSTFDSWEEFTSIDNDVVKSALKCDFFERIYAPSKGRKFFEEDTVLPLSSSVILTPVAEIIGKFYGPISYRLRYVRTPRPIILTDLSSEGLSINGCAKVSECELSKEIHSDILQRAVELAKASFQGDFSTIVSTGNASATDKGVVPQSNRY